jgi:hypothetical protein
VRQLPVSKNLGPETEELVPGNEEEDREGVVWAIVICEVCGLVRAL